MFKKNFIKKYVNKKFKYFKYIRNFNLWIQVYITLIAKYILVHKVFNKKQIVFNQTQEYVRNQN